MSGNIKEGFPAQVEEGWVGCSQGRGKDEQMNRVRMRMTKEGWEGAHFTHIHPESYGVCTTRQGNQRAKLLS
jgi:hypothetical protein